MRGLLWPTYSYAGNVGADSLYLIARNLLREARHGVWYLIVPDWDRKAVEDDLDDNPHVVKVPVPMEVLYRAQEAVANPDVVRRFAPNDGALPVDVMVSMSPARTLNVSNAWSIRPTNTASPVLVNWDLLVRDDHSGEMQAEEVELMHQAAGCWAADWNVFESPIARKMALDVCRKHLSASAVKRVMDSSTDVPQGIPVDRLLATIADVPKREKFAVYYGGRLSTSKRFDELAEVIDKFYAFGRDVEFVVTCGSLDGQKREKLMRRFPQVELHVGLSQENAWRMMASCHASICFSSHELFGMAFWEQMAAGLRVVMKAERWNRDLLPPKYDLVVGGMVEAGASLRMLYETWQKNADLYSTTRAPSPAAVWVRENYDSGKNLAHLMRGLEQRVKVEQLHAVNAYDGGSRKGLVELASTVLEEGMSWTEYVAGLRDRSRVGHNVVGAKTKWARSNAMLDAYRVAQYLGWRDEGGPEPTWTLM